MRVDVVDLPEVALDELEDAVGAAYLERGLAYATGGQVVKFAWEADGTTLVGKVVGKGGLYSTTAHFSCDDYDGTLYFAHGECSCPVGFNCEHVAAIVIAAMADPNSGLVEPGVGFRDDFDEPPAAMISASRLHANDSPAWERSLRALVNVPVAATTGSPLAIELSLKMPSAKQIEYGRTTPQLLARLMRPGARPGWINGGLAWNELESYYFRGGDEVREDHLEVARELYAMQQAHNRDRYRYVSGADRSLDLAACETPQLWAVLDEAERLGIPLIHTKPDLGPVHKYLGEILINVMREESGDHTLHLALAVDDPAANVLPLMFIGERGHGLVCIDRADVESRPPVARWRLSLVELRRNTVKDLQPLVLDGATLTIPAADIGRFTETVPGLRNVAPVVSSDGSFTPPEVSQPRLVMRADYGENHMLDLGWEWEYRIGERPVRAPIAPVGQTMSFRDLHAEQDALDAVAVLDGPQLLALGLVDDAGRPTSAPPVTVDGMSTVLLSTAELPRIASRADIELKVTGTPLDYRAVDEELEIGISTAAIEGDRDWFDLGVSVTVEGNEVPFVEVFTALAQGASLMILPDGAHFSLLAPQLQTLRGLIEEARALTDTPRDALRISRYQTGMWEELAALGVVAEQADDWLRHVEALRAFETSIPPEPPEGLLATLRPYQREGFAWLASLWQLGIGGILADDMGLGKTLQALALILHAKATNAQVGPMLVVAPTSVVSNWVAETQRFAPTLNITAVTDTLKKSKRTITELVGENDIVVTTYTLLRLDEHAYASVDWAGVLLDEAQFVKNHRAKTYGAVRKLSSRFTLAITGTPMENNLMELWSLLSITAPGLFPDPKRFADHYAKPIERGQDNGDRLALLRRRIRPLMKRRTKELVASELPAKQEQILEVALHPRHRKVYDTFLQRERQKILQLIDDFDKNRFTILRSITLLRQLSLHPGLVDEDHRAVPCAKLTALTEQLDEVISGGHRALVFSQFTSFLGVVKEHLEHEKIAYSYLDGSTRNRARVLEEFKSGSDPVFLISLKAGGFGLNLTEADYCFLLDPWWNPAAEAQAIDRTHRIGQTRPVNVYRLIAADTIEEKVVALAQRKAELFRGVMDDGDLFAGSITADDIVALLD